MKRSAANSHLTTKPTSPPLNFQASALGHGLGLLTFLLLDYWGWDGNRRVLAPVTLRVDLVGLPRQIKPDVDAPKPVPTPELTPPPPTQTTPPPPALPFKTAPDPTTTTTEEGLSRAERNLNRLKRFQALETLETAAAKEKKPPAPLFGNQQSPGRSVAGNAKEHSEVPYPEMIRQRLQEYWRLPRWLHDSKLNAQIRLFIAADGDLLRFEFLKSSGHPQFDQAVQKTVQEAAPFPLPPQRETPHTMTLDFGFPL